MKWRITLEAFSEKKEDGIPPSKQTIVSYEGPEKLIELLKKSLEQRAELAKEKEV